MILLGIDFSKNSPGVTVLQNDKFHFFSFARDYKINSHKKAYQHHVQLDTEVDDCTVIDYTLLEANSKKQSYITNEINKLKNGRTIAGKIMNAVDDSFGYYDLQVGTPWYLVRAGIEGYSYGSKGNVLIDLVTMTTILKDRLERQTRSEVFVFAPTQVKAVGAGIGRAGKDEMFEAFISDPELSESSFKDYCSTLEIISGKIPKPIDDIIDSYFVLKTLRKELETSN